VNFSNAQFVRAADNQTGTSAWRLDAALVGHGYDRGVGRLSGLFAPCEADSRQFDSRRELPRVLKGC